MYSRGLIALHTLLRSPHESSPLLPARARLPVPDDPQLHVLLRLLSLRYLILDRVRRLTTLRPSEARDFDRVHRKILREFQLMTLRLGLWETL